MNNLRIAVLLSVAITAGTIYSMGCGSSSSDSSTTSSSSVSITGTAKAPTSANIAVAKSSGAKAVSDAAAANLTCTCTSFEGEALGTATSDSAGMFSVSASLDSFRPADATAGSTWTEEVKIQCVNSDGSVLQESYVECTVTEGSTATCAAGDVDTESTMAYQALAKKFGCDPSSGSACVPPSGVNAECLFALDKAIWESASTSGSGSADDAAWIKQAVQAAQLASTKPSDLGYSDWGDCASAMRDGTISSSALSTIAGAAASALGTNSAALLTNLQAAPAKIEAMRTVLTDNVAGSSTGTTAITSISAGKVSSDATSQSICANALASETYAKAILQGLLAEDSATDMAAVWKSEAFLIVGAIIQKEIGGESITAADDGFLTDGLLGNGAFINTYLEQFGGTYTSLVTNGTPSAEAVGLMYELTKENIAGTSLGTSDMEEFAKGIYNQVQETGYAGCGYDSTTGRYNDTKLDLLATTYMQSDFVASTYNYQTMENTLGAIVTTGTTAYDACVALVDPEAKADCYEAAGIAGIDNPATTAPVYTPPSDAPTATLFTIAGPWSRQGTPACTGGEPYSNQLPSSLTITNTSGNNFSETISSYSFIYAAGSTTCTATPPATGSCSSCMVGPGGSMMSLMCTAGAAKSCSYSYLKQ